MSSPVPAIVVPSARMTPAEYFSSLHAAHSAAKRAPCAHPPRKSRARRHSPTSPRLFGAPPPPAVRKSHPFFDMHRSDGKPLRLTHATLVCFFDLTVEQTCEALLTNAALVKRLRCWYGTNRWPRSQVAGGTHPTFTLADIRVHRNGVMRWAFESGQEVLYDSLVRATRLLSVDSLVPLSADVLDALDGLFGEEGPTSEPVTDFPFSVPPPLLEPEEPATPAPAPAPAPCAECESAGSDSLPPGLFPWNAGSGGEVERDEDDDFFRSLCGSSNPFE